jgi:hypothetical protein
MFKYDIMKPEFKLADTSLMREVELLQQSAAFLFGAGVIAGFINPKQLQSSCPDTFDSMRLWPLWGAIAASLLFAVLSAFFARMMASMLWSLSKDYLDRLTPVFEEMYPDSPKLAAMLGLWRDKEAKRQDDLQADNNTPTVAAACAGIRVVCNEDAGTGQEQPNGQHNLVTTTSIAADAVAGHHADSASARGSASAGSLADEPLVKSASMADNNMKAQVKQLTYWNAVGPALKPGLQTIRAFIFITKVCFLFAMWLWLVAFMVVASNCHPGGASTLVMFTAVCVWAAVFALLSCMVRHVFAVFRSYHKPSKDEFWPDNWKTTFTFDEAPKPSKREVTMWGKLRQITGCLFGVMQATPAGGLVVSAASGNCS